MLKPKADTIAERMQDNERLLAAMDKAVHEALRVHKLLGQSIVTWEDGKVKIIPPELIPVNGEFTCEEKVRTP